jgi:hypothetical protein
MSMETLRASVLAAFGASGSQIDELLTYNRNQFNHGNVRFPISFPLPPEEHVTTWEQYAAEARTSSAIEVLQQRLPQLQFPIHTEISQTEAYRAVTRRGLPVTATPDATGLDLREPEKITLLLHHSLAGVIPVLIVVNREDFVSLVRALARRNEPEPVPASMGACLVSGYNNWDRIRQYRNEWQAAHPDACSEADWQKEFRSLIQRKERYQDRFMILSTGPYSDVTAANMAMQEEEWQRVSLTIRLEHECTHYLTRRLLASMHNNLLDELIADYRGITAATGRYRADWFLRFLGLEVFPAYRESGRLGNYRGDPPLSNGTFRVLQALARAASLNLERFDRTHAPETDDMLSQGLMLIALTRLTLEELASEHADSILLETWHQVRSSNGCTA